MQRLTVEHETTYTYARPVPLGEHRLMFRPRDSHDLRLIEAKLTIEPTARVRWLHDVFGNSVAIANFNASADRLYFRSSIVLDRFPVLPYEFPLEESARTLPFGYEASEMPDLQHFVERHYPDPERKLAEWVQRFLNPTPGATNTEEFLLTVTQAIPASFRYDPRYEPGVQSPVETLRLGSGTCRDYALFMMEAVRSVGLAARFVSGYLYDPAIDGAASATVGAGATHAWVQVYLPGAGWVEFDPTNGLVGGQNLVPIAVTREPSQAIPVTGTFEGTPGDALEMAVNVTVRAG